MSDAVPFWQVRTILDHIRHCLICTDEIQGWNTRCRTFHDMAKAIGYDAEANVPVGQGGTAVAVVNVA